MHRIIHDRAVFTVLYLPAHGPGHQEGPVFCVLQSTIVVLRLYPCVVPALRAPSYRRYRPGEPGNSEYLLEERQVSAQLFALASMAMGEKRAWRNPVGPRSPIWKISLHAA